jgi:hypothetical protein
LLSFFIFSLLRALPALFVSKHAAMSTGVMLDCRKGMYFAVHRYYLSIRPGVDVLYGRAGDASSGEGVAVARVALGPLEEDGINRDLKVAKAEYAYVLVTYRFPKVSPAAVAALVEFCEGQLKPLLPGKQP